MGRPMAIPNFLCYNLAQKKVRPASRKLRAANLRDKGGIAMFTDHGAAMPGGRGAA